MKIVYRFIYVHEEISEGMYMCTVCVSQIRRHWMMKRCSTVSKYYEVFNEDASLELSKTRKDIDAICG